MMYNEKMLESFSKEYAERCQVTDKITAEMFDANGVGFPYPHLVTVPYEKPADFVGKEDIFVEKKDLHQDLESWQQVDADAVDI